MLNLKVRYELEESGSRPANYVRSQFQMSCSWTNHEHIRAYKLFFFTNPAGNISFMTWCFSCCSCNPRKYCCLPIVSFLSKIQFSSPAIQCLMLKATPPMTNKKKVFSFHLFPSLVEKHIPFCFHLLAIN